MSAQKNRATAQKKRNDRPGGHFRFSPEIRAEIIARLKAGESGSSLAREFNVSRQAISLIKVKEASAKTLPRLVAEEVAKLRKLATNSRPSKYGFVPTGSWNDEWTAKLLHKLGEKVAKRRLMLLPVRRLFQEWFGDQGRAPVGAYDPDRADSLARIPKDLRDAEFLEFLRGQKARAAKKSPGKKTKPPSPPKKRRKNARSDMPPPEAWEILNPESLRALTGKPEQPRATKAAPVPPPRTGKHRGSKGSPFTPARKKKKR